MIKNNKKPPVTVLYFGAVTLCVGLWGVATVIGMELARIADLKPVAGCTLGGFAAGWVASWVVRNVRRP